MSLAGGGGEVEAVAAPTARALRWAVAALACLGVAQAIRFLRLAIHEGSFQPERADWTTLGLAAVLWMSAAAVAWHGRRRAGPR